MFDDAQVPRASGSMDPPFPQLEKFQPTLHQTILDIEQEIKSPHTLILSSLLATLSLASQSRLRVVHPTGQTSPLSLYLFSLAVSGERKTATDAALMQEIVKAQRGFDKSQRQAEKDFEFATMQWEHRRKFLDKQLSKIWAKKATVGDYSSAQEDTDTELPDFGTAANSEEKDLALERQKHNASRPALKKGVKLQIENVTPSAFLKFFDRYHPATGIIADEGAGALMSFAAANVGNLNNSWNGKTIHVERSSTDSFSVEDPRLTIHLMLQPEIFNDALQKKNNFWVESGLVARALFAAPVSKIGTRNNAPASIELDPNRPGKEIFHERIRRLIARCYENEDGWGTSNISFDHVAAGMWRAYLLEIEGSMGHGMRFHKITGAASKAPENVARIAALLQCYENACDDTLSNISVANFLAAKEIGNYYLEQQLAHFAPPLVHPGAKDAFVFWSWFYRRAEYVPPSFQRGLSIRQIQKIATPHRLRRVSAYRPIVEYLEECSVLEIREFNGEEFVFLSHPFANTPPNPANWPQPFYGANVPTSMF